MAPLPRIRAPSARNQRSGVLIGLVVLAGCASSGEMHPPTEPVLAIHATARDRASPFGRSAAPGTVEDAKPDEVGMASWYGRELAGRRTSSGERFDPRLFTGAHRRLPFGTWVEVRRVDTGRTVRVRINDRGPNGRGRSRIIDLSRRAAEDLGLVRDGVAQVELRIVQGP